MDTHRMALIGSGKVGRTLGAGFAKLGHEIMLGTREPSGESALEWREEVGYHAEVGTSREAALWAEWVFLCVPGKALDETLQAIGADALDGKIVVDVTNALKQSDDNVTTMMWGTDDSSAEHVQRAAPGARVVKAFNTTGYQSMIDPAVDCSPPSMPICGNDPGAKAQVSELLVHVGWAPIDLGGITSARAIEAMLLSWLLYGRSTGRWNHCFRFTYSAVGSEARQR